jgi:hypothetical protein
MKAFAKKILSRAIGMPETHSVSERDIQLLDTVKRELLPQGSNPLENFVPQRIIGNTGFSLHVERQLELLKTFQTQRYQSLFQILRNSEEINVGFRGKKYTKKNLIHNGYYASPDAEVYAAMIASNKPDRIIEIGSGYSTVIARTTVENVGLNCEIHVIDPQPRRDIESFADHIEYQHVERSSLSDMEFSDKTLLFIDSSHVCRSDGDLPYLYCGILPQLPAGILVHIHDIFLPFDYPDNYFERFYTEEYLLHALLAHSTKFDVVFSTHYLTREHGEAMRGVFGPGVGEDPLFFGASFWIRSLE